jgi:hypothetical protein
MLVEIRANTSKSEGKMHFYKKCNKQDFLCHDKFKQHFLKSECHWQIRDGHYFHSLLCFTPYMHEQLPHGHFLFPISAKFHVHSNMLTQYENSRTYFDFVVGMVNAKLGLLHSNI